MLVRVHSLFVGRLSTASVLIMLLVAAIVLRRRRARICVVVLAAGRFAIAAQCVRRLTGRGTRRAARFGPTRRRRRRREEVRRNEDNEGGRYIFVNA
jgi:hypothetical protein